MYKKIKLKKKMIRLYFFNKIFNFYIGLCLILRMTSILYIYNANNIYLVNMVELMQNGRSYF